MNEPEKTECGEDHSKDIGFPEGTASEMTSLVRESLERVRLEILKSALEQALPNLRDTETEYALRATQMQTQGSIPSNKDAVELAVGFTSEVIADAETCGIGIRVQTEDFNNFEANPPS